MLHLEVLLTINARRVDRFGASNEPSGEIIYEHYVDGVFLGRSLVDLATRRGLLGRLHDLTAKTGQHDWDDGDVAALERVGRQLFTMFLPDDVQRRLAYESVSALILELQDHDIPWELLHNGDDFLAHRFPVSRRMIRPNRQEQARSGYVSALLVGDPRGDLVVLPISTAV